MARGFYTVQEAARLIRIGSTQRIYGWLRGYPHRRIGPLLARDYQPVGSEEELSFLDLMEVRFVEHFREHGVRVRTLRLAAEKLRERFKTAHPFALDRVVFVADKADILVEETLKESASAAEDPKLWSLLTSNYVIYEAIKQSLLPGVRFDTSTHLARAWVPVPDIFPRIVIDPKIAYGQPTGPSKIPTAALVDAWHAEGRNADAVSHWYEVPTLEVHEAVKFEKYLDEAKVAKAA
ncbi:MAG: hypothetical protein AB7I59_13335 [Geminicoccaceae bacterium]